MTTSSSSLDDQHPGLEEELRGTDLHAALDAYADGGENEAGLVATLSALRQERGVVFRGNIQQDVLGMQSGTVSAHPGPHFAVLGYQESAEILRSPAIFSNRIMLLSQGKSIGNSILAMDDPDHRSHRQLVSAAFRPRAVMAWRESVVRPVAHELIDGFVARGSTDLARTFARDLPATIIFRIIGLPQESTEYLNLLAAGLLVGATRPELAAKCSTELARHLGMHLQEVRRNPRDDVMTTLVHEEIDGKRLTDEEIITFLRLLLPAGAETTTRLISSLMLRIMADPALERRLRDDPEAIMLAVTETQRLDPPFPWGFREVMTDTVIAGMPIPSGSAVTTSITAANRDPRRYENPDDFVLDRETPSSLTFGLGVHVCLGIHLARMEAEVAAEVLLERLPKLRLAEGFPVPRVRGLRLASPPTLHAAWA